MSWKFHDAHRWLVYAGAMLLTLGGATVFAADSETREFAVLVDGKQGGSANMTIQRQDDGVTVVSCATKVEVRVLIKKYVYVCENREVWKGGRLQQMSSRCNDDGKQFQVSAVAQADGLHVRVNGRERTARPESWLSSYWTLPEAKLREGVVPVIDADNGRDLQVRIQHVGAERINVAGEARAVQHYRLTGSVKVDLWYDDAERLVRQSWVEEGHPTVLQLVRVRR